MAFPDFPTIPDPWPSRVQTQSTFDAQIAATYTFYGNLETWSAGWRTEAESLEAALVTGNLPSLTGHAGKLIGVNGAEDSVAFARPGAVFATYGGTANAITLTTGLDLDALIENQEFIATIGSTNTGATTVNIDGIGNVAAVTDDGTGATALPAGYIRTDVPTRFRYDGTSIVVGREVEEVTNSNGTAYKYANGRLEMEHTIDLGSILTSGSGDDSSPWRSDVEDWTLPVAAAAAPVISLTPMYDATSGSPRVLSISFDAVSTTSVTAIQAARISNENDGGSVTAHCVARGTWY